MATIYAEGRSLGTDLLAAIRTAILTSSDWSRPNAGAKPNTLKATTTRGAQMVIDLEDAALTNQKMQYAFYTSYDGTTFGDKKTGYLWMIRTNIGTLATNYYYWRVSAGKEHLFISIDGPKYGDPAGVLGWGGARQYLWMCDLVPYYDNTLDPAPAYICGGSDWLNSYSLNVPQGLQVFASRNAANNASFSKGYLQTLAAWGFNVSPNRKGLDGKIVLPPWVYFDDIDGQRGRLNNIYSAGYGLNGDDPNHLALPIEQDLVIDGKTYKVVIPARGNGENQSNTMGGSFGFISGNDAANEMQHGPLIAIPVN